MNRSSETLQSGNTALQPVTLKLNLLPPGLPGDYAIETRDMKMRNPQAKASVTSRRLYVTRRKVVEICIFCNLPWNIIEKMENPSVEYVEPSYVKYTYMHVID